jgi:hypothetical protein
MDAQRTLSPTARLRLALDLFESGVALMRQKLRRERPSAQEAEIDAAVVAWLRTRPGAEHGDAVGRPRPVTEGGD